MEEWFLAQVALSFLVGGGYVALTLRVAELSGTRLGGMLLGLPSTALVGLFFIGQVQGVQAVVKATLPMPLTIAASGIFLVVFFKMQKRGIFFAWAAALLAWFSAALAAVTFNPDEILSPLLLSLPLFLGCAWFFRNVKDQTVKTPRFHLKDFLIRAGFSGLVIASTVAVSKIAGPQWGGLMAAFPAAFSSTVLLLGKKSGDVFKDALLKAMQQALLPLILFVTVVHFAVEPWGLIGGLLAGYAAAVVSAVLMQELKK